MTQLLVSERLSDEAGVDGTGDPPTSRARRAPFWLHVVALGLILAAVVPIVDNGSVGSPDEGAALAQAALATPQHDWRASYWAAAFDPEGRWVPLELSSHSGRDFLPYTKRPAYPAAIAPVMRLGGLRLVLLLHVAGTLVAAVCTALLAGRLSPRLATRTLWFAGIGSPLLFDGYQVMANSLATAAAAVCLLLVVDLVRDRDRDRDRHHRHPPASDVARLAGAVTAITIVGLLRTEGVIFAIALAVALLVTSLGPRLGPTGRTWRAGGTAVALLGGAAIAHFGSAVWEQHLVGAASATPFGITDHDGWLVTRLAGLQRTVFAPDLSGSTGMGLLTMSAAALVLASVVLIRRRASARVVRVVSMAAAVTTVIRVTGAREQIPGLLFAAPLLVGGLLLFSSSDLSSSDDRRRTARLLMFVAAVHVTLTALTQYKTGGSYEWGWRYAHVVLPALIPISVAGLSTLASRTDRTTARVTQIAWVTCLASFAILSVLVQRESRRPPALVEAATARAVHVVDPSGSHRPPLIVTSAPFGRYLWKDAISTRQLLVQRPEEVASAVGDTLRRGDDRLVLGMWASDTAPLVTLRERGYQVTRIERLDEFDWNLYEIRSPSAAPTP